MPERDPEVEQLVRAWLGEKQAARQDGVARRVSEYAGALAIGTDEDEWWSGTAEFRAAHVAGGPFTATVESVDAHRQDRVAWAAVRAIIDTGEPGGMPIRLTLVLIEEDDGWRIVQSHA